MTGTWLRLRLCMDRVRQRGRTLFSPVAEWFGFGFEGASGIGSGQRRVSSMLVAFLHLLLAVVAQVPIGAGQSPRDAIRRTRRPPGRLDRGEEAPFR